MSADMSNDRPIRTYRGRSLEELIPKIRAELGPDAIILREREGLTGGFNGFFQQRCVEVDAQAAPGIDFYDDEEDAQPGAESEYEPIAPPEPAPEAAPSPQPAPTQASVHPEPPNPYAAASSGYSTYASQPAVTDDEPEAPVPAAPPETPAPAPVSVAPSAPTAPEELTFAQRLELARQERESRYQAAEDPGQHQAEPAAPQPEAEVPEPTVAPPEPEPTPAEPEPDPPATEPTPPGPEPEPPEPKPTSPAPDRLTPRPPAEAPRPPLAAVDTPSSPRHLRVLGSASDQTSAGGATVTPLSTGGPSAPPRPGPAGAPSGSRLDSVAAGTVARDLVGQGISEAWAHELIITAAAHLTPFMPGGDLRAGVRAAIAGGVMAPPPLPAAGAAVAFVGSGGSGKTRCAAALAAAYARASTLRVEVLSLGTRRADVEGLLADHDVPVHGLDTEQAAEAVARGREQGLVVIDTATTSPVNADSVTAVAEQLEPLGLDAIYMTLPATMSATAARWLLDGLAPLRPSALVITHADEARELGIITELAYLSGLPIAFIHGGLDLETALSATDPAGIAARVLP